MRARRLPFVSFLIALALTLTSSVGFADQFVPVTVTPNVTPTTTESADGLKAPKGETTYGSTNSQLQGGDNPSATVNINVNVKLNSSWYGQQYTNNDGSPSSNPCYGSKFALTKSYIDAHEQEHVRQIADNMRQYFQDNGVQYQPSSGSFKFGGATTNANDIAAKIQQHVENEVKRMTEADQAEYANHDNGGNFGGMEGGARAASCNEFMARVGNNLLALMRQAASTINDVNNLLKEAQSQADKAGQHANNALQAAKDALAAAEKCDWDAFKKALDKYKAEMAAAQAALDASDHALDQANDAGHAGRLSSLASAYDAAKAANGVTTFKGRLEAGKSDTADGTRDNIDHTLKNLKTQTGNINAQNGATRGKLKKAKDLMDKAWDAWFAMKWGKEDAPNYKAAKAAHDEYEGKNGYAPTPKPSPTATPTPTPSPSPTPEKTDPPIGEDSQFNPETPHSGDGTGQDGGVYVPPAAGPRSEVTGTVEDPNETGPHSYLILTFDQSGHKTFWRGVTDKLGQLHLRLPDAVVAFELFRRFDRHGNPDLGAHCDVGNPSHLAGTQPLPNVPNSNPAIVEGDTAYQQGGADHGVFTLHTRGNDPLDTRVLLDGKPSGVKTLAASNNSVVAQVADDTAQGRHSFAIESGGRRSNAFQADIVSLTAEPLPLSHPGTVETVRVHVNGLPAGDTATMDFQISGSSVLAAGGTKTTVPVVNGVASVQIRGIRAGQALMQFVLNVRLAGT